MRICFNQGGYRRSLSRVSTNALALYKGRVGVQRLKQRKFDGLPLAGDSSSSPKSFIQLQPKYLWPIVCPTTESQQKKKSFKHICTQASIGTTGQVRHIPKSKTSASEGGSSLPNNFFFSQPFFFFFFFAFL